MNRTKSRGVLIGVLATLALSLAARAAQFEHPDLKSGKLVIHSVLILPPQVRVTKAGVKGQERLIEESQQLETTLPGLVTKALEEKGCKVLENPFAPGALEKDPDLKYALADIQGRFDALREQLNRKSKDVRKGRFTLGDEVSKFNPGAAADALVFVRGEGVVSTGGKVFFAALAGMRAPFKIALNIAVVDAHTGAILYYGDPTVQGTFMKNFLKNPEQMGRPIKKSFKNFVGPATPVKKAGGD